MATLTVTRVDAAAPALNATYASAASGGDVFANDGRTFARIANGSGSPITVTIDSIVASNQGVDNNETAVVGAGQDAIIGPFNPNRFNTSNNISLTYSGVTSLTIAVFRLGDPG